MNNLLHVNFGDYYQLLVKNDRHRVTSKQYDAIQQNCYLTK